MQDPPTDTLSRQGVRAIPKEASTIGDGEGRRPLRRVPLNNGWLLTLVTIGAIFLIMMSCVTIVVLQLL